MQQVYKAIGRVASQNVNVLIRGESGTGKELVAHAIYRHSARSGGRFLAVNCAAIPETLLESELFGHEKGSFTGAHNKRVGKFEQCSGGTLFLDEVGDMTPLMQSKVLRVLEEKQFERVGGNETVETDVRIIAATNRNLEQMLTAGQFRPDLYYRLDGFGITLPPLRERADDMVELVEYFLACFSRELGKNVYEIPPETMDLLLRHPWPGNIRELQSVLRQSLLYATSPILLPEFLPTSLSPGTSRPGFAPTPRDPGAPWLDHFVEERLAAGTEQLYAESLALMERLVLTRVLRHADGNQSRAAKILGITRGSLRSKIRAQGIAINQNVHVADPLPTDLTFSMPSCSQPG
jgi:two-component system nitrogen regulation response regulator GlnG